MWQAYVGLIEQALLQLSHGMAGFGIPYSFGFAIIFFTLVIKGLAYPLTMKQIKTSRTQQELQPKLKALQEKYKDDREALSQAQMELYKEHGINPLGGCLPMLIQIPIWMGLYRALFALAKLPNTPLRAGFFWIPSLAGPVDILSDHPRSIDWLLPNSGQFLGWGQATAYLILPVILVISQIYTQRMMRPQTGDSQQNVMSRLMIFTPLMFGYFSLVVPSALTLYWITTNVLGLIQQHLLIKQQEEDTLSATKTQEESHQLANAQEVGPAAPTGESALISQKQAKTRAKRRTRSKSKRRKRKK